MIREILKRLSEETGVRKQVELQELLSVTSGTMDSWKKRETTPYHQLIELWFKQAYDIRYVITGERDERAELETEAQQNYITMRESEIAFIAKAYEAARRNIVDMFDEDTALKAFTSLDFKVKEMHYPQPDHRPQEIRAAAEIPIDPPQKPKKVLSTK